MLNLMKADLYRITKTKGFYIYWIAVIFTYALDIIGDGCGGITLGVPVETTDLKNDIGTIAMNLNYYFFSLFIVYALICGEYSEHTIKNTISSTISKKNFFISKYIFTLGFIFICFIFANYAYYFINSLVNGEKSSSSLGEFSEALFRQSPLMIAIFSLFIGLAFLLRKGAAFNAVTIITPVLYSTVSIGLYSVEKTKELGEKLLTYDIATMLSRLAINYSNDYTLKCYAISAVIIILSFAAGYLSFTKRELE